MPNTPKGFLFAVADGGFRKEKRNNLALVFSEKPACAAGVFTLNKFCAAPVFVGKEILASHQHVRGAMFNSGQANACTGEQGMKNCRETLRLITEQLRIEPYEILPASTGVIGEQFDMDKWEKIIPTLAQGLGKASAKNFAEAIITSDSFIKMSDIKIQLSGGEVALLGMAKGAGMICPNMATMLSVVLCDAEIEPEVWRKLIQQAVKTTFNRVTVDGDTSTNDTVYALANGASGIKASPDDYQALLSGLTKVLGDLAYMLVKDGEGSTKVLHIKVKGTKTDDDAEQIARTIGHSPLVKTAMYGRDANWGRIVAAIGRSGVEFDPLQVRVSLCGYEIFAQGQPADFDFDTALEPLLKERDLDINVTMGSGSGEYLLLAADLSHAYVDCNASYRS